MERLPKKGREIFTTFLGIVGAALFSKATLDNFRVIGGARNDFLLERKFINTIA